MPGLRYRIANQIQDERDERIEYCGIISISNIPQRTDFLHPRSCDCSQGRWAGIMDTNVSADIPRTCWMKRCSWRVFNSSGCVAQPLLPAPPVAKCLPRSMLVSDIGWSSLAKCTMPLLARTAVSPDFVTLRVRSKSLILTTTEIMNAATPRGGAFSARSLAFTSFLTSKAIK